MTMKTASLSEQLLQVFTQVFLIRGQGIELGNRAEEELVGQIQDLRKKLATPKAVTEAAKNLKAAEQRLATIEQAIVTKGATLEGLQEQSPDLSELFRKRADVLADIELGNAKGSDLIALDQKIDAERQAASMKWAQVDQEQDRLDQLIEGLKRKAEIERQEIERLTEELDECSVQAVLSIALDKAELYTKHATEAVRLYREVTTLNEVLQTQEWGKSFNGFLGKPFEHDVLIPALNAPPFSGDYSGFSWKLFDLRHMGFAQRRRIGVRVPEIDSLKKAGAVIPELPYSLDE